MIKLSITKKKKKEKESKNELFISIKFCRHLRKRDEILSVINGAGFEEELREENGRYESEWIIWPDDWMLFQRNNKKTKFLVSKGLETMTQR